jgi:putative addiction module component (TIGR02574 family)
MEHSGMATDILDELLKLPPSERADLASALWESLTDAEREAEVVLSSEQKAVLARRLAEHEADPGSAIPWEIIERTHRALG